MSVGRGRLGSRITLEALEGNAIEEALASNVIVVAAAGNDGTATITAPACDTGVIAVGASALADGQPNGSSVVLGSAATPLDYVASYSNYGSPAASVHNASAWGIIAPGGDPASNMDADDLHWIENIWTSTPIRRTIFQPPTKAAAGSTSIAPVATALHDPSPP